MEILIDKEYLLTITKDICNDAIDYLGKTASPRYVKWGEISGKRVKIRAKLKILADYFEVNLVNDVSHVFYVSRKMLGLVPLFNARCQCTNRQLFSTGCRCGAFLKEMSQSS